LDIRQRTYTLPGSLQLDFNPYGSGNNKQVLTPAIALDVWHHVFAYIVNPNSSSSYAHLFIDGVESTALQHNFGNFEFEGTVSQMRIGKNRLGVGVDTTSNITISDIYVSTNPDFGNHLNAYYTNTNIPTASYDVLIPIQDGHDIDNVSDVYWSKAEVPASSATGLKNALQGQGIIGDSFIGTSNWSTFQNNATSAYVDLGSKIPNLSSNFFGVSFWYKPNMQQPATGESFLQIHCSNSDGTDGYTAFSVKRSVNGVLACTSESPITNSVNKKSLYVENTAINGIWNVGAEGQLRKTIDEWIHIFAWVDWDNSSIQLDVSGSAGGHTLVYPGIEFSSGVSAIDSFKIGHSNQTEPGHSSYICNLHWSTNREFKNTKSTYLNQEPTKRLFERPNFTTREMFTQDRSRQGNDVPLSDWNNAMVQIDGIVGKGAEPISATPIGTSGMAYIDLSERNPIFKHPNQAAGTWYPDYGDFLGVSLFFKVNDVSKMSQPLLSMNAGPNSPGGNGSNGITVITWPAGGPFTSPYVWIDVSNNIAYPNNSSYYKFSNQTPIVEGQWHHLFFYYEVQKSQAYGFSSSPLNMFIDGVEQNSPLDLSATTPFGLDYIEKIYTHGLFYDAANDGPAIGDSTISINNLYMSSDQNFTNKLDEYAKLPTVEVT
jgi:hypothetical protein